MALKIAPLRRGRREIGTSLAEINVTPFVDVMLVLLVIFMVTAPMMQSGIGVALPQAETDSAPAEEGVVLTITKDRYIHVGEAVVNLQLLERTLKNAYAGREKKIAFIQADKDLSYGFFIETLDAVKKAGVEVVGLVTEPGAARPKPRRKR